MSLDPPCYVCCCRRVGTRRFAALYPSCKLSTLVSAAVEVLERGLIFSRHLAAAAQVPAPHQVAERVALRVAAIGAGTLGRQFLLLDEQLRSAGILGQQLDAAGALQLDRQKHGVLDGRTRG